MRCSYGCPWYADLSEVSAGLLPEPAWSFMTSLHIDWCMVSSLQLSSLTVYWWPGLQYLLLPLTSITLVTEKHSCWSLDSPWTFCIFMACWPVDLIIFYCTVWRSYQKLARSAYRITIFNCLQKICISGGMRLRLFWLKTSLFGKNGLILPSHKTVCSKTVQPRRP